MAYCDGRKLYLNGAEFGLLPAYYPTITDKGNYLTFYAIPADKYSSNSMYGAGILPSLVYYMINSAVQKSGLKLFYLDIHKNYAEPLNAKTLKWLLKDKPDLLKQYKTEHKKIIKSDSIMMKYIAMLNE